MAYSVALFSRTEQVRVRIYIVCHILISLCCQLAVVAQWTESHSGKSALDRFPYMLHCFLFLFFQSQV